VSLTAVVLAPVIAEKELLMCLSGSFLHAAGRLFSVGDWIECQDLRGELTDHALISATLLEVEPSGYGCTGRRMTVPNSLFPTHPVRTSPFARRRVTHRFVITLETPVDAITAVDWLSTEAERALEPLIEDARRASRALDRRFGVNVEGPEPRVGVGTSDLGKQQFRAALFCPREQASALERDVTARFLTAAATRRLGP
jgi:small-conductance mechanosensitive channel